MGLRDADLFLNVGYGQFTSPKQIEDLDPLRIGEGLAEFSVLFIEVRFFHGRLLTPFFIFHRKYFSNPTFIHFAQIAFLVKELCLGGRTG